MQLRDTQLGTPHVLYRDTKSVIEALTGISQGAIAYATDTDELGTYDGSAWVWGSGGGGLDIHDHSGATEGGKTLQVIKDIYRFGFVTNYAGTQETTIAFDGTNTFTLSPTGTEWSYYRNGVKYTITGSKTVTLSGSPPAAKGTYYIVIDSTDGTLSCSTTAWTLADTKLPVACIAWDNTLTPKYWLADERHTCAIDRRFHYEHHWTDGTEIKTAPVLSGYSVAQSSPTDTQNTFAISESKTLDEDLEHTLDALSDPDGTSTDYVVFYLSSGAWLWEASEMPYRYTAGGYIQYNNAGTMTQGQNNKFYNTWLLLTNLKDKARFAILPGKAEYGTLAEAQAASFTGISLTGLPINEFVAVYQLTWDTSSSYTTKGKARLAAEPKAISVSASGSTSGATVYHENLPDLLGGAAFDHYHLTGARHTDLTDGGDSTLHYHAADRVDANQTFTDVTTNDASTTKHGFAPKATAPASGLLSVLGIGNGETVRSDKALFDTTNPAAIGTAAPGTQLIAARRDHVHAGSYLSLSNLPTAETNTNDIFRCDSPGGTSAWTGTINGTPSGASVVYNLGTGTPAAMVPTSTSQLGKMRLYNTTRGTSALILNVNTGTKTITLTGNAPAAWANGDALTIASQTVTGSGFGMVDIEITSGPTNKSYMFVQQLISSNTVGDRFTLHPYETHAISKYKNTFAQAAGVVMDVLELIKITDNVFSLFWTGTPLLIIVRESGYLS